MGLDRRRRFPVSPFVSPQVRGIASFSSIRLCRVVTTGFSRRALPAWNTVSLAGADGLNLNRPLEVVLCKYHGLQGPSPVGPSQSEQRGSSRSGIGRREAGVPDAARTSTRTESRVHRLGLSLTHQPRDRKELVKADSAW